MTIDDIAPPKMIDFTLLVGKREEIIVPVYQRDFVWNSDNATQLTDDISTVLDGSREFRFLGTIVVQKTTGEGSDGETYEIIDGQQRVTCLFLLLVEIQKKMLSVDMPTATRLADKIEIFSALKRGRPCVIKLKPRQADRDALNKCLDGLVYRIQQRDGDWETIKPKSDALTKDIISEDEFKKHPLNKIRLEFEKYIDELLVDREQSSSEFTADSKFNVLEDLWDVVTNKLVLCQIELDGKMDPHEVFERLNHAGVDLTHYDLTRNYLMMALSSGLIEKPRERTKYLDQLFDNYFLDFENNWIATKELAKSTKVLSKHRSDYVFALAQIRNEEAKQKSTFESLRNHFEKTYFSEVDHQSLSEMERDELAERVMNDLRQFVNVYNALNRGEFTNEDLQDSAGKSIYGEKRIKEIQKWVRRFGSMKTIFDKSTFPYVLQLLHGIITKSVPYDNGIETAEILESFIVRRSLLGESRKGLNLFRGLFDQNAPENLKDDLLKAIDKESSENWASNTSVADFLRCERETSVNGIYGRPIARYLIWEFDLEKRSERKDERAPDDYTIDHVIPRSLKENQLWKDWSLAEYEKRKHQWANLIPLTSRGNSSKSAQSFSKAKNKFQEGGEYTTARQVFKYKKWTPDTVAERTEELIKFFVGEHGKEGRWALPSGLDNQMYVVPDPDSDAEQ